MAGYIQLLHKTDSKFRVDVASMMIKPFGRIMANNKQNNKRLEPIIHEISPIEILKMEPIELAQNKTLY